MAGERAIPLGAVTTEQIIDPRQQQEVLDSIFSRFLSRVYTYHAYNGGNEDLAQRATRATFHRINIGLSTLPEDETALNSRIFGIVYNEAQQAQGARTIPVCSNDKPITDTAERILRVTFGLPDEERHIMLLKFVGGLTFLEIADIIGRDSTFVKDQAIKTLQGIQGRLQP